MTETENSEQVAREFFTRFFRADGWRTTALLVVAALGSFKADPLISSAIVISAALYIVLTVFEVNTERGKFKYIATQLKNTWKRTVVGVYLGVAVVFLTWWTANNLGAMAARTEESSLGLRLVSLALPLVLLILVNSMEDFILEKAEEEHRNEQSKGQTLDGEDDDKDERVERGDQ